MNFHLQCIIIAAPSFMVCAAMTVPSGDKEAPYSTTIILPEENVVYEKSNLVNVNFKKLHDVGLSKLGHGYFGFTGSIPDNKHIDYNKALYNQWKIKLAVDNLKPSVTKSYKIILDRYNQSEKEIKSLSKLLEDVDADIKLVRPTIKYKEFCAKFDMKDYQCRDLIHASNMIDSRILVSYGLTEIMPYQDGKTSAVVTDVLLKTAGENFINSLPAKGDGYLSFGFYQFTSFAVRKDASGPQGANVVSEYSDYNIPSSVMGLTSKDQHRAALYFSIYNLTKLFKSFSVDQHNKYVKYCQGDIMGLNQFIATAHHLPTRSIDNTNTWIYEKCSKPFVKYQGPALSLYAKKTQANYFALGKYI